MIRKFGIIGHEVRRSFSLKGLKGKVPVSTFMAFLMEDDHV